MYGACPICGKKYGTVDALTFFTPCEHMKLKKAREKQNKN